MNGFVKDDIVKNGVWDVFRYGWFGREKDSSILFEVEASRIAVQYKKYANHPAPIAKLVIDDDFMNPIILDSNFQETWGDCLYLQDIISFDVRGKHTVEIIITESVGDKDFYFASVITA